MTEWNIPGSPDDKPYPIGIDPTGRIFTQSASTDRLDMFDPKTEKFTTYHMRDKGLELRDFFLDEGRWL